MRNDGVVSAPLVVQESFPEPGPRTNPYISMLLAALRSSDDLRVLTVSWRNLLFGRYDVVHLHWPETLLEGRTGARTAAKQLAYACFLGRLWLSAVPVVRTVHNVELPTGISWLQRSLLRLTDRMTTLRIRLNPFTEITDGQPSVTILHGDYSAWFAAYPRQTPTRGRAVFAGLIRRYKGVGPLVRAFRSTESARSDLGLVVAGSPSTSELADEITREADKDPRVRVVLRFLTDAEYVELVTGAELVVLPYPDMHNSGSVLAALSLGRPVLVPDNAVNRALGDEVGVSWVQTYTGALTGEDLERALDAAASVGAVAPDLSRRDWRNVGDQHLDAFRVAVARGRRRLPFRAGPVTPQTDGANSQ